MLILEDEKSYEKFDVFLREHRIGRKLSIDGILCTTDRIACYVINVLKRINIRVPEDVQVIGFDGIRRPGCFDYLCSTIVQPVPEMAQLCVDLLFQEASPAKPRLYCLPVSYVYGETTREI